MPTTTPTILDQISAEKTKLSERLARLDTDRATVATQLTDLETAERVLTRVSKAPPGRKPRSAASAEAKVPAAPRGRGRPPKAAMRKSAGREPNAPEPWRARPSFGYRQDPTGTLSGVPQRSPEPYRHRSAAPSPCRTDPGARRQAVCDIARGTLDSLNRNPAMATSMSN